MKLSERILQELYSKYKIDDNTYIHDIQSIMTETDYDKWKIAFKYPNGRPFQVIQGGKND